MTEKQRQLLYNLHNNGGTIQGVNLSAPLRSIATRLQLIGLVSWKAPKGTLSQPNLDNWILSITDKGRSALGV
jgi:hypothetical protein